MAGRVGTSSLAAAARFLVVSAPAGFGKTRLVDALTSGGTSLTAAAYDCRTAADAFDLTNSVRLALLRNVRARTAREPARSLAEAEAALFEVWPSAIGAKTIVFDHADALRRIPGARELVDRLLAIPQGTRRVAVCSRRPVPLPGASFALPHETLTLGTEDLRLSLAEIRALLEPADAAAHATPVAALSGGWPAAVLFLRTCAQEGSLLRVLDDPASPAAARFHVYVDREIVAGVDESERKVAFACAALARATAPELYTLLTDSVAERGTASLMQAGLLQRRENGDYVLHPLVAATLRARYPDEYDAMMRRIAASFARTAPLRAAPLLAAIGDARGAAAAYAHTTVAAADQVDFDSSLQAAGLDRDALLDNLALFNAATQADYYGVDVEDWLVQAQEALRRAGEEAEDETRAVAVMMVTMRFALVGRWDDGHAFLARERARASAADDALERRLLLLGAVLDAAADRPIDLRMLRDRLGGDLAPGYLRALFARRVASSVASLHGRTAEALRELEIAHASASASGRAPYVVELSMLACFEAWRAGDDEGARGWYERALVAVDQRTASGARFFLNAFSGTASLGSGAAETAMTRAHACLIAASFEQDAAHALAWLDAALQAAERTRRPLTIVLARIALASVDPDGAPEHLRLARELAAQTPSLALRAAVEAVANGDPDRGMLGPFVERFARVPRRADLELDVIGAAVRWRGDPIVLEERPFSVLCVLALSGGPLHQDQLIEALWPNRALQEMANALRVHVSAVRRALTKEAIVHERGRYRLRCSYRLDLDVYERLVHGAQRREVLRETDRRALRDALDALERGGMVLPHLELAFGLAERITGLRGRILVLLAEDALMGERFEDALRHAQAAQTSDPYDDRSAQIVVAALWGTGRRAAAARAFREHADLLRRELGIEPSTALRDLVSRATEPRSRSRRSRSA
ncbi:MAG TPA: BTAD domain-containing putative transcriptional regulator [Candidatus Limnocylindria bacterium]|nr:BTAD domain-containing putative transcriptional regulator [Candidatus Limnocylindria bacterium]